MTKTVLITGATRGIGLALATIYAENGWRVLATSRVPKQATQLHDLARRHRDVAILSLLVEDDTSIQEMAKSIGGEPIDLLINNAGILSGTDPSLHVKMEDQTQIIGGIDREGLRKLFDVNTLGPIMVTQALLPNLRLSKTRKIAMISSRSGSIGDMVAGDLIGYRTSKAALNAATKNISIALQDEGFVVVTLNPGWVQTDMGSASASLTAAESAQHMYSLIGSLKPKQTGQFLRCTGEIIPW